MTGKIISHYRIIEKLGEGGMGVVYKAEDTKLRRSVALKLLTAEATGSPEAQSRLLKEAEAAAALDHPNITTIYEVGEESGQSFIAMAFVDGKTLAQRIAERPLPLAEALDVASQVAAALEAAHEGGVVHRDIKPGNIMLTEKGQVKVMDFGLAHLADQTRITKTGTIMGTPAYMSPEQARGEEVGRRSDIWSLGVVLYEMIAGRLPFRAESSQAMALTIQNEEPEALTALRADAPLELDWIVGKCLAKDRGGRYQHAEELGVDLRAAAGRLGSGSAGRASGLAALSTTEAMTRPPSASAARSQAGVSQWKVRLLWAFFGMTAMLALVFAFTSLRPAQTETDGNEVRRFTLNPPATMLHRRIERDLAVSPNGRHVVFASAGADGKLWVHDLDRFDPRALEGTEGAEGPFWSPGSDYIGYFVNNELLKVPVAGDTPTRLCGLPRLPSGGTWSPDGETIVMSVSGELFEAPARGGEAVLLRLPNGSGEPIRGRRPHFLPVEGPGRSVVFDSEGEMYAVDLISGRRESLGPGAPYCYSVTGHFIYAQGIQRGIWALPFSAATFQILGDAFPITGSGNDSTVSTTGTLVYHDRPDAGGRQPAFLDRSGDVVETIGPERVSGFGSARLSPDGTAVAYSEGDAARTEMDIWVYDLTRGVKARVSSDPLRESFAVWSPTGRDLAHGVWRSRDPSNWDILVRSSDGSGEARELIATPALEFAQDWSKDGNRLLCVMSPGPETGYDIWYLERGSEDGTWEPKPFLVTPNNETRVRFSPDERHVVYVSDESGTDNIYVRAFPEGDRKWLVSGGGGNHPRWSGDGTEIFYINRGAIYSVPVTTDPVFAPGTPVKLFEHWGVSSSQGNYDVTRDGQRFLVALQSEEPQIRVVQNWFEEFREQR